jgi:hypothetical protein
LTENNKYMEQNQINGRLLVWYGLRGIMCVISIERILAKEGQLRSARHLRQGRESDPGRSSYDTKYGYCY